MKRNFCRDRAFLSRLFSLMGFIALQNVVVCLVGLADNVMLGAYDEHAMAGVSLANQVQFLLQMMTGGIGEGMAVLTAQYWGTGRTRPIRRILSCALWTAIAVGAIFFCIGRFQAPRVLSWLSTDAQDVAEGARYMRIMSFSYIFFCIGSVLITAHRSVENVRVGMIASVCALVVNIVLNYILIFGHCGAPRMGVTGAAIATLCGRIVEAGIAAAYSFCIDQKLALRPRHLLRFDRTLTRDTVRVATPVLLANASWGVAMAVQTAILGHLSHPGAVAANAIATTLFQVVSVAVYGLSSAAGVLVGKAVGSGEDVQALRGKVNTLQVIFLGLGLITGLTLFLLRGPILSLYDVAADTHTLAERFMTILSVTVVGTGYQVACLTGIVRGGGNTKFVFYNDLIFMWGVVLPSALLSAFAFHFPPEVVFACLKSDQILKCAVAVIYVNSYRWVRRVAR